MFQNKRVFISGGAGVIGQELVKKLTNQGATLFVGDLKSKPQAFDDSVIYRQGDLNYITKEEIESFAPEYFFHLAATFERSTESYGFWEENNLHNLHLSSHLMSIIKDTPSIKRVVNCSSYLIYDPKLYSFETSAITATRLCETDPIYPRNLTGVAKLNHEIELRFLHDHKSSQFTSVSARIYRSYGLNSRDIISRWIRALLENQPLTVFRKEGLFDYIFAREVAEGLLRLAANHQCIGIYNLGNDNARRVSEVLEILRKYFPNLQYKEVESDISFEASQANMDKTFQAIGWKPALQLEDAITEMIEFEKTNGFEDTTVHYKNVLITSISKKVPLIEAVKKAAKKLDKSIKVFGGDISSDCLGAYFVDVFWKMPSISKITLDEIVGFCNENNINCIIPTRDGELVFWAKHKAQLKEHGIHVMVSHESTVSLCLDKLEFSNNLASHKAIPSSEDIETFTGVSKFVVKERYGAGSMNIGINLSKEQALDKAAIQQSPIFQPYFGGQEVSVDAYISSEKKVMGVVSRTRDLVIQGESQVTTTIQDSDLEQFSTAFLESLDFYGHVVLQIIKDSSQQYHIIECNSRFGGASTLSIAAGLDSFYWFLLESNGTSIDTYPFVKAQKELKQVRYPSDVLI
ncbi:MAG TPA: epimerase [Runella sp.]|nr:epimerase [Runella sp.]